VPAEHHQPKTDSTNEGKYYRRKIPVGCAVRVALGGAIVLAGMPVHADDVDAGAPAAGREEELDEVTITSGRRDLESVRDEPVSISVISGDELERENVFNLDGITKRVANVKWNFGNSQTSGYSIRGVGKVGTGHASDPSVGIAVDGVAYAYNPLASFDFYDVESVQVNRGPQGTRFGRASVLGSIFVTTKAPSFNPDAEISVGYNIYDAQSWASGNANLFATASVTGPIVDGLLAYRASVYVDRGSGYTTNAYSPDYKVINKDRVNGRFQLLFTPLEGIRARLIVEANPRNNETSNGREFFTPTPTTYADGSPNPLSSDPSTKLARRWFRQNTDYNYDDDYLSDSELHLDNQGAVVTGSNGASLSIDWEARPGSTLTSISAIRDYYFNAGRDDDGTVFDILTASGARLLYKQLSQELRFQSSVGAVDYTTGLYLAHTRNNAFSNNIYGSDAGAWYANNNQYSLLDADAGGRALLTNSLAELWRQAGNQLVRNDTQAVFADADWHAWRNLTISAGVRFSHENRRNTVYSRLAASGFGAELNPAGVNGVDLGGFASSGNGSLTAGQNSAAQLALANAVAQKYFGVATYAALTDAQRAQVGAAKAIRASQIGLLWNPVVAESYKDTQPLWRVVPRYEFNENLTGYVSWAHGEKAGVPQVVNSVSTFVGPERNEAYELGLKTTTLDGRLVLNADVFLNDVKGYQQAVRIIDAYTTRLNQATDPNAEAVYTNGTGNVPKVRVKGVEIDSVFTGIPYTQLRLSGAYNDARYRSFTNSAQPSENGNLSAPYRDVSGSTLPGAAKWTFDLGGEFRKPVIGDAEFHASVNVTYTSRYNSDNSLSSYGWVPANTLVDASLGIGSSSKWDFSLYVKNLLNDDTPRSISWNNYVIQIPRLTGVVFRASL
jgi:outer membrane receptor protein involved in Fe transport